LERRLKKARLAAWVGIGGNFALAVIKGIAGWASGSQALIADAANSAGYAAGSAAELAGLKSARRFSEADRASGRTLLVPAIIVSLLLMLAGLEISIRSVKSIVFEPQEAPGVAAITVLLIAIFAKEGLYSYSRRQGKTTAGHLLAISAKEHRHGLLVSLIALAGIAGALLGDLLALPVLYALDPLAGLAVSAAIVWRGFKLAVNTATRTEHAALRKEETAELLETIQHVRGVVAVDELHAREIGHYVVVDAKISVNPKITVWEGHEIGKAVKLRLMKTFSHVSDVLVHVHPYDPGYPYKAVDSEQNDWPSLLH
jgi:cation diffusion facilitator family transporter